MTRRGQKSCDPSGVQPVPSRYTDCTSPALAHVEMLPKLHAVPRASHANINIFSQWRRRPAQRLSSVITRLQSLHMRLGPLCAHPYFLKDTAYEVSYGEMVSINCQDLIKIITDIFEKTAVLCWGGGAYERTQHVHIHRTPTHQV
jgi:hypothetical protein